MDFLSSLGNLITNSFDIGNLFGFGHGTSAFSKDTGTGSVLGDLWDKIKNGNTNDVNYSIAQDNLAYQRERNAIEDARYEEETAYNRAWQEDERNYNRSWDLEQRDYERALQERLFEREDTAIERQASQLSKLGINPVSQNLNGLGAGQALTSADSSQTAGATASTRGGTALHNDFQKLPSGILDLLAPLESLATSIQDYQTGNLQRDALALQNDKQFLENFKRAHDLGITYSGPFKSGKKNNRYRDSNTFFNLADGKSLFDTPEYQGTLYNGYFDNDTMKGFNTFSRGGFDDMLARTLTKGEKLFDNVSTKLFDKENGQTLFSLGEYNGKFNPLRMLFNLFF